ncbi:MAG: hypothetical protein Q9214_004560, partial [Letrouitia sp. 1 TL-2023]
ASVFVLTTACRLIRVLFRNHVWGKPTGTARLLQINDVIKVRIGVPRPWYVKAGDYVYVWIPGLSFWSLFESHPFMVVWWDQDAQEKGAAIYLLVKQRSGFTQKLLRHVGPTELKVWVDGPYRSWSDFGDFGSIIMFASGIGIAAQVPHIKEILRDYKNHSVRTRSITLIWQMDRESKYFRSIPVWS